MVCLPKAVHCFATLIFCLLCLESSDRRTARIQSYGEALTGSSEWPLGIGRDSIETPMWIMCWFHLQMVMSGSVGAEQSMHAYWKLGDCGAGNPRQRGKGGVCLCGGGPFHVLI